MGLGAETKRPERLQLALRDVALHGKKASSFLKEPPGEPRKIREAAEGAACHHVILPVSRDALEPPKDRSHIGEPQHPHGLADKAYPLLP